MVYLLVNELVEFWHKSVKASRHISLNLKKISKKYDDKPLFGAPHSVFTEKSIAKIVFI